MADDDRVKRVKRGAGCMKMKTSKQKVKPRPAALSTVVKRSIKRSLISVESARVLSQLPVEKEYLVAILGYCDAQPPHAAYQELWNLLIRQVRDTSAMVCWRLRALGIMDAAVHHSTTFRSLAATHVRLLLDDNVLPTLPGSRDQQALGDYVVELVDLWSALYGVSCAQFTSAQRYMRETLQRPWLAAPTLQERIAQHEFDTREKVLQRAMDIVWSHKSELFVDLERTLTALDDCLQQLFPAVVLDHTDDVQETMNDMENSHIWADIVWEYDDDVEEVARGELEEEDDKDVPAVLPFTLEIVIAGEGATTGSSSHLDTNQIKERDDMLTAVRTLANELLTSTPILLKWRRHLQRALKHLSPKERFTSDGNNGSQHYSKRRKYMTFEEAVVARDEISAMLKRVRCALSVKCKSLLKPLQTREI